MQEVATKALDVIFESDTEHGVADALLAGTGLTLAEVRSRPRLDWETFRQIMHNAGALWSADELVAKGAGFANSSSVRALNLVARLLFTTTEFYRWIYNDVAPPGQMFSCMKSSVIVLAPGRLRINLSTATGYKPCPQYFLVAKGAIAAIPRIFGLPQAVVDMDWTATGAAYTVLYEIGGGALAWLRRALAWPVNVFSAGRALKQAHEDLLLRFHELDLAQRTLDRQARQLKLSHTISGLLHQGLDLGSTLEALVSAMITEAGFTAVRVRLQSDIEGNPVPRIVGSGIIPTDRQSITVPLQSRGRVLGDIELWAAATLDPNDRDALLGAVLPVVEMAIDNALTFTAVKDLRDNLERKVEHRTAQLCQAQRELVETIDHLREAQGSRDRIFANISHEIRTPLSLIKLAATELQKGGAKNLESRAHHLHNIERAVAHLLHLVEGMLLLAAGQDSPLSVTPQTYDLVARLERIVTAWSPVAQKHGLTLRYDGPSRCRVRLDPAAVERTVTNLIANAVKFTPAGGFVHLGLCVVDDDVEIAVRDSGIGIEPAMHTRVFERFEQAGAAVRPGAPGSGIGLAIVKELVEAHGGHIELESAPGKGSCFTVCLPRVFGDKQNATAAGLTAAAEPLLSCLGATSLSANTSPAPRDIEASQETILVAEDELELRRALSELLCRHYRVLLAADAATARTLAQSERPDLLITDLGTPGINGLALGREFRALPETAQSPVLFLTAFGQVTDRLAGFPAGAVDYLVKPFSPDELLARIRTQLAWRALNLRLQEAEQALAARAEGDGLGLALHEAAAQVQNAANQARWYSGES